ncbi:hypothetical protein [Colwellia sp. 20A7]|uniref:hypothetical protein n=1 Tax=Colwellia sp. 20A7 TaxID=2689569 RepID=UPI00135A29C5|nr:hypothetical protein [Colwellia sp. 20A7]
MKINLNSILLFISLFVFSALFTVSANNTISIDIANDDDASLLMLPIPNEVISVRSNLAVYYKDIPINATFYMAAEWPNSESTVYVRTLLIDSPELKGFSGKLSFVWSNTRTENSRSVTRILDKDLRVALSSKTRTANLVYPSKHWLRQSLLLHPMDQRYETDWYVLPQEKYAHFVTNKEALLKKGYPPKKAAQWLYDRPQALYQLYIMTEDKQWLTKANTLADFYQEHLDEDGQFTLKNRFDPKYLMPAGLAFQYLLNADESALKALTSMFQLSLDWDEKYSLSRGFWTERNQAAALNVAVRYWELTQDKEALLRINDIIDATVKMTFNPESNWPIRGCPQHSFKSHEGWGDDTAACSPWMMALLGDALWHYYRLTGDEKASALLNAFGDFILNNGIYYGDKRVKNIVIPKYIVSMENPEQEELNQWSDPQHACDVAALLGKSVYIKELKGQDAFVVKELFRSLVEQCKGSYQRLKAEKTEKKFWTLMPPRRFAWMYSSTSDLPWLVDRLLN